MSRVSKKDRVRVLQRDGFACRFCGRRSPEVKLHVDHIKARANQGSDALDNLASLCEDCNVGKSALDFGNYTAPDYAGPMIGSDVPLFTIQTLACGTLRDKFSPQWRIAHVRGPDTGFIEWRWRSRYCLSGWERVYTEHLGGRDIFGCIDYSVPPSRDDDRLTGYDLGVEIRYRWGLGSAWRHELHSFPVEEHPIAGRVDMELKARDVSVQTWFVKEATP